MIGSTVIGIAIFVLLFFIELFLQYDYYHTPLPVVATAARSIHSQFVVFISSIAAYSTASVTFPMGICR